MNDLANIFLELSAKKGNKYAAEARKANRVQKIKAYINKVIEFISVNLQAEYNRILGTPLGKIHTHEIGCSIMEIIEDKLERAIFLIEKVKSSYPELDNYIPSMVIRLNSKIINNEKAKEILKHIFELHLFHDFDRVAEFFYDIDVHTIDLLLKYLVLINLQRRLARRKMLPH